MNPFSDLPLTSALIRELLRQQLHLGADVSIRPVPPNHKVALYLHIPFCESLCTYCTFHRELFSEPLARAYFAALRRDIELAATEGWQFNQVYIGGGTPTVLIDELCETIQLCQRLFSPSVVSVETNPNHLQSASIEQLLDAGVKRLSVGVQSLDDSLLQPMNRLQAYGSGADILPKLVYANSRFETFNVDMIFNLPGQSTASLNRDIQSLTGAEIQQISWYPLMPTREKQSLLKATMGEYHYQGERQLYEHICRELSPNYSMNSAWCFSRENTAAHDEYVTQSEYYLGLGSGAFSYVDNRLLVGDFNISRYITTINSNHHGFVAEQQFTAMQALSYKMMIQFFSLQITNQPQSNKAMNLLWQTDLQALKLYKAIRKNEHGYEVTEHGKYLAMSIMKEFYIAVNYVREQMRTARTKDDTIICRSHS